MEESVEKHLPLVRSLANRFRGEFAESDDLFQVGCIGLLKALKTFDPERGTAFTTYAVPVIAGEIKMYLRGQGTVKYSRALKTQARRLKMITEDFEQRLGRQPTLSELAKVSGLEREELSAVLDVMRTPVSLDAVTPGEQAEPAVVGEEEQVVDRVALRQVLSSLPQRERQIVLYRFFRYRTQQDVAEMLGISQMHVSRLERKILDDMKKYLTD
ncbi:MAG: sigma-70 family RNA polymerase sigma factor [Clostridiales bacterium]|jgi:RNA polymerase sporulation-specific sigma factor|nr:sigma-70 family RNA polymerase sigma factor [Clostridiales bacterium]